MLVTIFKALIIFLELVSITRAKQIAAYWGQGAFQESLASYCEQENMDIAIISFVNNFQENEISFNFGNACDSEISCPSLAADINRCQSLGVKVLVSLGGANGQYGVSENDVSSLADTIFQDFGPDGTVFPGALIDGFDLDIESGEITGYVELVKELKDKFANGNKNKEIVISVTPQCVYPDKYLNDVLINGDIDFAFIQFYNNHCNLNDISFNWNTWVTAAANDFKNKKMQLFIGLPGSEDATSNGYVDIESVKEKTKDIICEEKFGGFMVWDVHFAMQNSNYLSQLKNILNETVNTSANSAVLSDDAPTTTTSDSQLINTIYTEFLDGAATLTTTAVITDGMTTTTTNDFQLVKSIHTTLLDGATTLTTTAVIYVSDVQVSSFFMSESPAISSNSRITQTLEPSKTILTTTPTFVSAITCPSVTVIASSNATLAYSASSSAATRTFETKEQPSSSKKYIYVTGVQQLEGGHVVVSIF